MLGRGTAQPVWSALRAVARAERRIGWRGLVLLAVLFGLVGGTVLGAGALAGRTATAYPRLVDAVGLDDARVMVAVDQQQLVNAVPRLPGIRETWVTYSWVARVEGPSLQFLSLGAGIGRPHDMMHPVVVAGRAPAPEAADEMLISEPLAEQSGMHVGDTVTLKMLTLRQVSMFGVGFGEPDGPTAQLRVVGVGRMPAWGGALSNAMAGPEFARRFSAYAAARPVFVRLADDPGAAQVFTDAFAVAAAAADALSPSDAAPYLPQTVELPRTDVDPAVAASTHTLVIGLALFAAVLGIGGLLVVGQGLLRYHAARRTTQLVESAIGLGLGERVAARVLAAAPAAVAAAVLAGGIAFAAGLLDPLGSQARFEPTPGFRPPWAVAVVGAVVVAVLFLALVAVAASAAGGRASTRAPDRRPVAATWGMRWPAVLVGLRLAVRGRRSAGGVPAVATVLVAVLSVAGIVAALVFGASVRQLVDDPVRYGQAADLTLADAREPDIVRIAADPRVAALSVTASVTIRLAGGVRLPAVATTQRKGTVPTGIATGREPGGPGEIALSPRVAERLGLDIGDVVTAVGPRGPVPLTVTGTVIAVDDNGNLGDLVAVAPAQVPALAEGAPLMRAQIVAGPDQTGALQSELGQQLEIVPRAMSTQVRNLADLVRLPEILAVVLGVVAGAAMAHLLLTTARRHRREMTVLSVLGATPGQVRAALAVLAGATVLPALLIGIPLGIGVARVLWWQVATSIGVAGDLAVPLGLLGAAAAAVLAVALLLAVVPGLRAIRGAPAVLLATT